MSEYLTVTTTITDHATLLEALHDAAQELGFEYEVHDEAQPLYGYRGDRRQDKAHVIIRRTHIGAMSNDLGYLRNEDGSYTAIVSEFDSRQARTSTIRQGIAQHYAASHAIRQAKARRLNLVKKERNQDGSINLQFAGLVN